MLGLPQGLIMAQIKTHSESEKQVVARAMEIRSHSDTEVALDLLESHVNPEVIAEAKEK